MNGASDLMAAAFGERDIEHALARILGESRQYPRHVGMHGAVNFNAGASRARIALKRKARVAQHERMDFDAPECETRAQAAP